MGNFEPDNNLSGGVDEEDCVVDSYTQSWYDVPCSFFYLRICQMDAIPPPYTPTTPLHDHHSIMKDIDSLFKKFSGHHFYSFS